MVYKVLGRNERLMPSNLGLVNPNKMSTVASLQQLEYAIKKAQ